MEAIREEIKKKQPLVSDVVPLSNLLDEFKEQPNFRRQIKTIIDAKTHSNYRPMRQDGNCFYRAFLLALFETIEKSQDSQLLATVSEQAFSSLHRLLKFHCMFFLFLILYVTLCVCLCVCDLSLTKMIFFLDSVCTFDLLYCDFAYFFFLLFFNIFFFFCMEKMNHLQLKIFMIHLWMN